jgi:hypothetical protein
MTAKANDQGDQELHHDHGCVSSDRLRPPNGEHRRDASIHDNVERRVVRAEAPPKLANNSRG